MNFLNLLFFLSLNSILSCQSAWHIKPENLARHIDKERVHKIADLYESHKGLVLIFWQSTCPCVKRYEARVKRLYEKYRPEGLAFVYVSSDTHDNEDFSQTQSLYLKRHMPLELIKDHKARLAHALEAKGTPAALLIDREGNAVFMGWIDNERQENERGRKAYLEDALKEYLAGKPVSVKTSPMFGCPIR